MQKKAGIIGLGLIGGSIGLALREEGWEVTGSLQNATKNNSWGGKGRAEKAGK